MINNDRYFCCLCNERPVAISCPDCNSDMYCSITCRDLDKETHQDICYSLQVKALSLNPSETLNRFSLGMNTLHFGFSPYHAKLPSERNPMYVQDGADLNLIVERTERSRNKAMAKAIHKFPNHILTIRIREIPTALRRNQGLLQTFVHSPWCFWLTLEGFIYIGGVIMFIYR